MQRKITTQELLNTQLNVEENNKENSGKEISELLNRDKIPGTPFWAITDNEKEETWLVFGEYRLTDTPFKNKNEGIKYLNENMYNILLTVIIIMDEHKKNNEIKIV